MAIVGNMNQANMIMGQGMQQQLMAKGMDPSFGQDGGPGGFGGGQQLMIGGTGMGSQQQMGGGQLVASGSEKNALTLFCTPHSLGGGGFGGGGPQKMLMNRRR